MPAGEMNLSFVPLAVVASDTYNYIRCVCDRLAIVPPFILQGVDDGCEQLSARFLHWTLGLAGCRTNIRKNPCRRSGTVDSRRAVFQPAADVKPDELFCARNDAPARGTAAGGSPLARVPNRVALSRARFHLRPRPEIAAWRSQCPNVC